MRFEEYIWSMSASELNRKLLFCGYDEATDYLNSSPLNRYFYKYFIDILPQYRIDVPIVTFFNEIYYQCVRINYDGTPGVDIEQRYIAEEMEWVKSERASQLIFCIVWALMSSKRNQTFHEECFLFKLTPYVKSSDFHTDANRFLYDFRTLGLEVPEQFPTMTCNMYRLPLMRMDNPIAIRNYINYWPCLDDLVEIQKAYEEYLVAWKTVTTNYSHYAIEKYLHLMPDVTYKQKYLSILRLGADPQRDYKTVSYLDDLEMRMRTGNFDSRETPAIPTDNPMGLTPDEYDEYRHNLALDRAVTDEELNKEEQLQRDCESLKRQLEEQQKSHEMEMARITAKHQAEIKKLKKKQTEEKKHTTKKERTPKAEEKTPAESTGQMFLVEEMIADVQSQFEMTSAKDFCSMYYRISAKHSYWDEKICKLVDAIVPAIKERESVRQTINIPTVQQLNLNPKEVVNHTKEE